MAKCTYGDRVIEMETEMHEVDVLRLSLKCAVMQRMQTMRPISYISQKEL